MSARPTQKVAAGSIAGAVTVIVVWAVGLAGLAVPAYVAAAVTLLLTAAAAYIMPES